MRRIKILLTKQTGELHNFQLIMINQSNDEKRKNEICGKLICKFTGQINCSLNISLVHQVNFIMTTRTSKTQ